MSWYHMYPVVAVAASALVARSFWRCAVQYRSVELTKEHIFWCVPLSLVMGALWPVTLLFLAVVGLGGIVSGLRRTGKAEQ